MHWIAYNKATCTNIRVVRCHGDEFVVLWVINAGFKEED